jgi:hypothetical protein
MLLSIALLSALLSGTVLAQNDPTSDVVIAAVRSIQKDRIGNGVTKIGFASNVAPQASQRSAVAQSLAMDISDLKSVRYCIGSGRSPCGLRDADAFVNVLKSSVVNDDGAVTVDVYRQMRAPRATIYLQTIEITLKLDSARRWVATGVRVVRES